MFILLMHVEDIKIIHGYETVKWISYFIRDGGLAVSLFFVLSGFLITYLLLNEKVNTSTINLKSFYLKRALRIWPLYFFIGIMGFFLLPILNNYVGGKFSWHTSGNLGLYFILYCLFLPVTVKSDTIGAAWSVRVEEVFYLFWPVFLRRFTKHLRLFIWIVVLVIIGRNVIMHLAGFTHNNMLKSIAQLTYAYRVSCMAIGGIGAYLLINDNRKILDYLYRKDVQWIVYGILTILLAFRVRIPIIYFEFYSVLFAFMVLNLAANPASVIRLDYNWMNYLGKVSYGIYLYNPIIRIFCLELVERVSNGKANGLQFNLLLYSLTIASTLLVSVLSFELFEKRFLKLKKKTAE